jgi:hypothetical protein
MTWISADHRGDGRGLRAIAPRGPRAATVMRRGIAMSRRRRHLRSIES